MGQGRWRDYTPLTERSQRMHQFTGRLLAGVADAAEAREARQVQDDEDAAAVKTWSPPGTMAKAPRM